MNIDAQSIMVKCVYRTSEVKQLSILLLSRIDEVSPTIYMIGSIKKLDDPIFHLTHLSEHSRSRFSLLNKA